MDIGMTAIDDACAIAMANARDGINPDYRFPRNVFVGDWSDFFFFDADWIGDATFVEYVKAFLQIERGMCVCLLNLDPAPASTSGGSFFIHEQTTPESYRRLLSGPSPGYGWLDDLARLACASDSGEWCMYCEPRNEIAVIGFRRTRAFEHYQVPMARFHAARLDEAIKEPPLSFGFSERALSASWRSELLREYATRSL